MFRKVLIANRGEIAVRLMRACHAVGAAPVTIHSEADRQAPHAIEAESYLVGPPPVAQSYLQQDTILAIAKAAGCEAVHPGYGLLSENAAFARAVMDAGMAWVGPPPEAISAMADKVKARAFMQAAGVPVVPGTAAPVEDVDRAKKEAETIGYPIMLKASHGGGGIGMQLASSPGEIERAFKLCTSRARAYFGNGDLYVEKALCRPRHIEVQLLADAKGHVIHLGERECTIQRRHQKVVEEAGSPAVTPERREEMGALAIRAAKALGYYSAGTLEFLLDDAGHYYFLEMNTRLQVEHPVTESITGIDIPAWQLRLAAGEALAIPQAAVKFTGHAFEARVYAEDPVTGLPAPGTVESLGWPPGVRVDTFIARGSSISPHYDPL
ncbi:MAG: ATP-grasp domain-containing protein, partial [Cyanobacteria bacterium REEB65]|nr:ATP-grasp domain-containing protein [Cyanobacteria bacterium REEB65]